MQPTKQLILSWGSWDDSEGEESSPCSLRNVAVDTTQVCTLKDLSISCPLLNHRTGWQERQALEQNQLRLLVGKYALSASVSHIEKKMRTLPFLLFQAWHLSPLQHLLFLQDRQLCCPEFSGAGFQGLGEGAACSLHPPEPGWVRNSGQPGRIDKSTLTKQLTCKLMERKVGLRCKC